MTDGDQATTRNFLVGNIPIPFPPASVVLEVLEDILIDQELIKSLTAPSKQGFQIALDDVTSLAQIAPLLGLAHSIKIDLMGLKRTQLTELTGQLRPYRQRLKLLAEKVET